MRPQDINILIACEYSGNVREAFRAQGFNAISCDLLPTERPGPHIQGDVLEVIADQKLITPGGSGFHAMVAHPPCTYLSTSGIHWNTHVPGRKEKIPPRERAKLTEQALDFARALMDANIPHIALENPQSIISTRIRPKDQCIQPWQFGHPESKATWLWLKNLPLLRPTNVLPLPSVGYWENQTPSGQNKIGPSAERWKMRAKTYDGIATAMATQWGAYLTSVQAGQTFPRPPVKARSKGQCPRPSRR